MPTLRYLVGIVYGVSNLSFVSEIELQVWQPENPDDFSVYKQFVTIGVGKSFVVTWGLQRISGKDSLPTGGVGRHTVKHSWRLLPLFIAFHAIPLRKTMQTCFRYFQLAGPALISNGDHLLSIDLSTHAGN